MDYQLGCYILNILPCFSEIFFFWLWFNNQQAKLQDDSEPKLQDHQAPDTSLHLFRRKQHVWYEITFSSFLKSRKQYDKIKKESSLKGFSYLWMTVRKKVILCSYYIRYFHLSFL